MDGECPPSIVSEPLAFHSDRPGQLVLVVGPSGVGKDTLLDLARSSLSENGQFHFVQRCITRPAEAGGENHKEITEEEFEKLAASNRFALHWKAHGLSYGLPFDIIQELDAGKCVIANVSRNIIDDARELFANVCVINITADPDILYQRLEWRARESLEEIRTRLSRKTAQLSGPNVYELPNNEKLALSSDRFLTLIRLISLGLQERDSGFTFA